MYINSVYWDSQKKSIKMTYFIVQSLNSKSIGKIILLNWMIFLMSFNYIYIQLYSVMTL